MGNHLRSHAAQGCRVASLADDAMPSAGSGRNFKFVHGAGDGSAILREGHHGIFNVQQQMLANGAPVLRPSEGRHPH